MKNLKYTLLILCCILFQGINAQSWSNLGSGVNGTVNAIVAYQGNIYVGGNFTWAGGKGASNIAVWNDSSWSSVDRGVNGRVYALQVYNGILYVGGMFTMAGGNAANNIASWDGTKWDSLQSGIMGTYGPVVYALTIYKGNLCVGGQFATAGGLNSDDVAQWNGNNWISMPGINNGWVWGDPNQGEFSWNYDVFALVEYNSVLYAGGDFPAGGFTWWDSSAGWISTAGNTWISRRNMRQDYIYSMIVFNGKLFVSGPFSSIYYDAGGNGVASWDSSKWDSLEGGVSEVTGYPGPCSAMTEYNSQLYIGGNFTYANRNWADGIVSWSGSSFSGVGAGSGLWGQCYALCSCNGDLYVGGSFDSTQNGFLANNIVKYSAPTGINEIKNNNETEVCPNPSNGKFMIQLVGTQNFVSTIEVYNVLGEKVYSHYQIIKSSNYQIDLSSQPNGIYFYRVVKEDGGIVGEGKLIIDK